MSVEQQLGGAEERAREEQKGRGRFVVLDVLEDLGDELGPRLRERDLPVHDGALGVRVVPDGHDLGGAEEVHDGFGLLQRH